MIDVFFFWKRFSTIFNWSPLPYSIFTQEMCTHYCLSACRHLYKIIRIMCSMLYLTNDWSLVSLGPVKTNPFRRSNQLIRIYGGDDKSLPTGHFGVESNRGWVGVQSSDPHNIPLSLLFVYTYIIYVYTYFERMCVCTYSMWKVTRTRSFNLLRHPNILFEQYPRGRKRGGGW